MFAQDIHQMAFRQVGSRVVSGPSRLAASARLDGVQQVEAHRLQIFARSEDRSEFGGLTGHGCGGLQTELR